MPMMERFVGTAGHCTLIAALKAQRVVEHHPDIAEALAAIGCLREFAGGETIVDQGGSDSSAFFILAGEVRVFVNNREVGRRGPRELVGEMVTVDPTAPRSATVRAGEEVVALQVPGSGLLDIANRFPSLWQAVARILCERLRERARYHRQPNAEPILFIGCSREGLSLAREIEEQYKHDAISVRIWTTGVFTTGGITYDDLLRQAKEVDFGLLIVTPDDRVRSRSNDYDAPRDNIVFELGLFMDRLGRDRAFMLREYGLDLKIPTDLLGITPLTYVNSGHALYQQLGPACNELRKLIRGLGPL
jgi:CRP/FNR family cyclic AMP-dependent transcriptional regulator